MRLSQQLKNVINTIPGEIQMMRRTLFIGLFALLFFSINGFSYGEFSSEQTEVLKKQLITEWKSTISSLATTRAHAQFLADHDLPIKFPTKIGRLLNAEFIASLEPDGLYVSQSYIMALAKELVAGGVQSDELAHVLALKTVPIIGHEIRHAIDAQELKVNHAIEFLAGSYEDETSAYFDQVMIFSEVDQKYPLLWWFDSYRLPQIDPILVALRQAWQSEPQGLEKYVRSHPPLLSSILLEDRIKMRDRLIGYQDMINHSLVQMEKRKSELLAKPPENRTTEEKALLSKLQENMAGFRVNLEKLQKTIALVNDEPQFAQLKIYYHHKLKTIAGQWPGGNTP